MSRFKVIAIVVVVAIAGIQFVPIKRNISTKIYSSDFILTYKPTEKVSNILKTSCYNCHSNNTNYPWYSHIQPVGLFLAEHIKDGKKELNFSEFGNYSERRQKHKLNSMIEEIKDDEMPLSSYTLIHRDAKLSDADKKLVTEYLESLSQSK